MTRKYKIVALVLAAAVFFAMMLSVNMIAHKADHECAGNACQVCQQIESSRHDLKIITSGIFAIAYGLALAYTSFEIICCFAQRLQQGTLVALKVELLN